MSFRAEVKANLRRNWGFWLIWAAACFMAGYAQARGWL